MHIVQRCNILCPVCGDHQQRRLLLQPQHLTYERDLFSALRVYKLSQDVLTISRLSGINDFFKTAHAYCTLRVVALIYLHLPVGWHILSDFCYTAYWGVGSFCIHRRLLHSRLLACDGKWMIVINGIGGSAPWGGTTPKTLTPHASHCKFARMTQCISGQTNMNTVRLLGRTTCIPDHSHLLICWAMRDDQHCAWPYLRRRRNWAHYHSPL